MPKTPLARLNEVPPRLCRAVARNGDRPISHKALGLRCGFSLPKMIRLSKLESWDNLSHKDTEAFIEACGLQSHRLKTSFMHRLRRMKTIMKHLTNTQRNLYKRLLSMD